MKEAVNPIIKNKEKQNIQAKMLIWTRPTDKKDERPLYSAEKQNQKAEFNSLSFFQSFDDDISKCVQ